MIYLFTIKVVNWSSAISR